MKLLMISGDRALAQGKKGAFYNTLEEFHKYWERIDIICPKVRRSKSKGVTRLGVPHGAQTAVEHHGGEEGQDPVFDNVFIHPSPWPLIFQPWWILKKGRQIYREHKFNLMTVHEYPPFYNGIGARMLWNKIYPVKSSEAGVAGQQFNRVKIPYILEIFHIPGYPKTAGLKEKIYRRLFYFFIKYDCRKAKAVRVMNEQVAEKLIDLGVPESKIKLIPAIYVDLDIFKPMGLEKKYDLIFIGRPAKNKGIDLLLKAVKLLITNYQLPIKCLIVGEGKLRKHWESEIRNWKLQNNVLFYGWAKDSKEITKLLNQSKILVMPSYNEGGPRVVTEALACGIPILATPVGIVADIMKDGQFGEIINWNAEDIAKKANSLFADQFRYKRYSEAGPKMANWFEKKSAIRNYAEKIKKLI